MSLKGTRTEKNILTAFSGESQARNRYTYFAAKARTEGYVQMAEIFEETANQEKEHAKRLFKLLEGGEVEITASFPAGVIGTTSENLKEAAGGEHYEYSQMYPGFATVAREEGFHEIADIFLAIAIAERTGLSIAGFVRGKRMNIYANPWRIKGLEIEMAWQQKSSGSP